MSGLGRMATLVLADVRERSRRFSFLLTLAGALWAGYGFLPPAEANYVTLRLGEHRGVYNSAWVGAAISLLTSAFLGLVGFYLVRGSVSRDRRTGVGQLLAATPLSRLRYLLSKAASNWIVLGAIALAVALSGAVMQWVRAEDRAIDFAGLLGPYLFLTMPALAFIAALAVLFECVPGLRGGGGNVLYFFVWGLGLSAAGLAMRGGLDYAGMSAVLPSMERACAAAFSDFRAGEHNFAIGINVKGSGTWSLTTFTWPGIEWSAALITARSVWLLLAFGVVLLATALFDRFATATAAPGGTRRRSAAASAETAEAPAFVEHYASSGARTDGGVPVRLARLTINELRLLLRGIGRFWYLVLLGLWIAALATPLETSRLRVLPLLWLWPVLAWSALGMRERRFGTDAILFSAPRPLALQLPASWLAGVAVAMLASAPAALRFALAGEGRSLVAWLVGAAFVPALALALGVWTGTSRAFEALYTALWYMGPLQPVVPLDFIGVSRAAIERGMPMIYAAITLALLGASVLGRRRQLRR